jgi:hypothetical protein
LNGNALSLINRFQFHKLPLDCVAFFDDQFMVGLCRQQPSPKTVFVWGNGVYLGTDFGAPVCHREGYYNTLFSDNSIRVFIDRANQFNHYYQDEGLNFLTGMLR